MLKEKLEDGVSNKGRIWTRKKQKKKYKKDNVLKISQEYLKGKRERERAFAIKGDDVDSGKIEGKGGIHTEEDR